MLALLPPFPFLCIFSFPYRDLFKSFCWRSSWLISSGMKSCCLSKFARLFGLALFIIIMSLLWNEFDASQSLNQCLCAGPSCSGVHQPIRGSINAQTRNQNGTRSRVSTFGSRRPEKPTGLTPLTTRLPRRFNYQACAVSLGGCGAR